MALWTVCYDRRIGLRIDKLNRKTGASGNPFLAVYL
jgi:hypothetical protein